MGTVGEKKRSYDEMEPNFEAHRFATSETEDSISSSGGGDNSENSSLIIQQISAATTVPATQGILQFFYFPSLQSFS